MTNYWIIRHDHLYQPGDEELNGVCSRVGYGDPGNLVKSKKGERAMKSYCTQNGGRCYTCSMTSVNKDCQNEELELLTTMVAACQTIDETGDEYIAECARVLLDTVDPDKSILYTHYLPNLYDGEREDALLKPWVRDKLEVCPCPDKNELLPLKNAIKDALKKL